MLETSVGISRTQSAFAKIEAEKAASLISRLPKVLYSSDVVLMENIIIEEIHLLQQGNML